MAVKCDHLVCFESTEDSYTSPRLVKAIEDSGFYAYDAEDNGIIYVKGSEDGKGMSIAPSGFTQSIPHSISIHVTNSIIGDEWAYCYSPNLQSDP